MEQFTPNFYSIRVFLMIFVRMLVQVALWVCVESMVHEHIGVVGFLQIRMLFTGVVLFFFLINFLVVCVDIIVIKLLIDTT